MCNRSVYRCALHSLEREGGEAEPPPGRGRCQGRCGTFRSITVEGATEAMLKILTQSAMHILNGRLRRINLLTTALMLVEIGQPGARGGKRYRGGVDHSIAHSKFHRRVQQRQ